MGQMSAALDEIAKDATLKAVALTAAGKRYGVVTCSTSRPPACTWPTSRYAARYASISVSLQSLRGPSASLKA